VCERGGVLVKGTGEKRDNGGQQTRKRKKGIHMNLQSEMIQKKKGKKDRQGKRVKNP